MKSGLTALLLAPLLWIGCSTFPREYPADIPQSMIVGKTERGIAVSENPNSENNIRNISFYDVTGHGGSGGGPFYPKTFFYLEPSSDFGEGGIVMMGYEKDGFVFGFDANRNGTFDKGDPVRFYKTVGGKDPNSNNPFPLSYSYVKLSENNSEKISD